ncbi:MAG: hypothetical protein WDN25_16680 [Acetobacteraceae bacterium]
MCRPPLSAVVQGEFRPRVTDLGQRHPVTEGLTGANPAARPDAAPDWGPWYRRIQPADVRGEVLLGTRDSQPLLLLDRVGKGRVALLLSDQIWLWSRGHEGGGPQAELLRRVAHWLMQEPELEENALTARVADGRLAVERRSTDPAPPGQVTVTDPDGKTQTLTLVPASPGRSTRRAAGDHARACGRRAMASARPMPRRARPIRRNSPICARPRARCGSWRACRAAGCISSAPARPAPRPTCPTCGGPSRTAQPPAVHGSAGAAA